MNVQLEEVRNEITAADDDDTLTAIGRAVTQAAAQSLEARDHLSRTHTHTHTHASRPTRTTFNPHPFCVVQLEMGICGLRTWTGRRCRCMCTACRYGECFGYLRCDSMGTRLIRTTRAIYTSALYSLVTFIYWNVMVTIQNILLALHGAIRYRRSES